MIARRRVSLAEFPRSRHVGLAVTLALSSARAQKSITDKSASTLFNPTPTELRRAYNTDRPSKTNSPFTVDAGAFQIDLNLFVGFAHRF